MPTSKRRYERRYERRCDSGSLVLRLLLAAMLLTVAPSCALFGFDEDGGFDLPISASESVVVPVDLSSVPNSGQTAPQDVDIPLDLPAQPVDLASASQDLDKNKDKLERLEIKRLNITPQNNSLTRDLPPIDLFIGPFDGDPNGAVKIATIPSIPAGSTERVVGQIDDAGMDAAQPFLTSLQFSFQPSGTLEVKQGEEIPGGRADLELLIEVQATVDPTL